MVAVVTGVASVFVASWTLTRRAQIVCDSSDSLTDEIKYLDNVFNKNNYNRDFIRHNTYRNSEPNATNTDATPVQIDGNLNWKHQISHICNKIAKTTGILCRARHYLPRIFMQGLYYALIYPYLSYGNIAWGNTYTTRLQPVTKVDYTRK